jgi:acyl dehydratase
MAEQLYYEDVTEGMEIPGIEQEATSRRLVQYCGAYEDFTEIHHDKDAAQKSGFPDTIVPGLLTSAILADMLCRWVGTEGSLKNLRTMYRRPHYKGAKIVCKGKVSGKRVDGGQYLVDCEIWAEDDKGEQSTPATATVALPSRGR